MGEIWTERRKYQVWLEVELAVCQELATRGDIPRKDWRLLLGSVQKLLKKGGVKPERVDFFEAQTRHDVIAFTTAVAEEIGPISRYIHFGLTSSDVVDTALSLQLVQASQLIRADLERILQLLKRKAIEHKKTATIGRSHGIYAEPTSFGLKFLGWYVEWKRNLKRWDQAVEGVRFGKLSGAVGVNAHWDTIFEAKVLKRLGLQREPVSTQVIPRDRHAELMNVFALCGATLERMAIELRHLQRTEVGEVLEGFRKGQKGSSAMPHKRNPISSENITGCARLLRSYSQAALENVALWHERDISHSAVERVIVPDAFCLLDYAINRMANVVENLDVRKDRIRSNLEKAGSTVFSGHYLLALVKSGVTREDAYQWVQKCALESLESGQDFVKLMSEHDQVSEHLTQAQIKKLGSIDYQLRHVNQIYTEAFKKGS